MIIRNWHRKNDILFQKNNMISFLIRYNMIISLCNRNIDITILIKVIICSLRYQPGSIKARASITCGLCIVISLTPLVGSASAASVETSALPP